MKRTKKWMAMLLAIVLCLGLVQTAAWADTDSSEEEAEEECEHEYGEPVFIWSEEDYSCVAEFTCVKCGEVQDVDCAVTSKTTATCTAPGTTTYTATARFEDKYYSDDLTVDVPATGHTVQWNAMEQPYSSSAGNEPGIIACYICRSCRARFADSEAEIALSNGEYSIPVLSSPAVETDKTALETAIEKAKAMNESDYPEANWKTLPQAITSAEYVLNYDAAPQTLVDGALKVLQAAMGTTEDSEPEPEPDPEPDPEPQPEPGQTGLIKGSDGKWGYYVDGKVDTKYTGFTHNDNGDWYVVNGYVLFDQNSVFKDTTGAIGTKGDWYYVTGSKVQHNFTGLANYKNSNGWWYIKNGTVDFTHNGVDKNKNGWYYVTGGKVQFGYTGVANYKNANGWWYIKAGKVDFSANTVAKNNNGWWYVTGGKVNFGYTNRVANYRNANGWWYIQGGKVDFSFSGIASNKNGTWYVKGGKVQLNFSGTVRLNGRAYTIKNGKAV